MRSVGVGLFMLAVAITGCAPAQAPTASPVGEIMSSASPITTSTPSVDPMPTATPTENPLDIAAASDQCADQFDLETSGVKDLRTNEASAQVRPDGLIFVTVPATGRTGPETFEEADVYCYLEPDTLLPYVSAEGYVAIGVTQGLDDDYDMLFNAADPFNIVLD